MKYTDTLKNYAKKLTQKSTKKSLMDELSKKLLRLWFKDKRQETSSIETRCLKHIVKKILLAL